MSKPLRPLGQSENWVFMIYASAVLFGLLDISTEETAVHTRGYPWEELTLFLSWRWHGLIEIVYDRVVEVYIYIDSRSSEIEYWGTGSTEGELRILFAKVVGFSAHALRNSFTVLSVLLTFGTRMVTEGCPLWPHIAALHIELIWLVDLLEEVFISRGGISAAVADVAI